MTLVPMVQTLSAGPLRPGNTDAPRANGLTTYA